LLIHWYKKYGRRVLLKRATFYSYKLGISSPEIVLADQKKRWGSCNAKGQIRLNWRIVMAPVFLIDYVVAHELCHLKFNDHSRDFWKTLGNILPDYEVRRERLRKEGANFYI
jgi:predicted metal-dependent hydrolase